MGLTKVKWKSLGRELLRRIASLHKPVQFLNSAVVVAQCLLLVSCAGSNFLANIYIFSYSATDSANRASQPSQLDIRVGYFFFCAKTEQDTSWICGSGDYTRQHLIGHTDSHSILRAAYDLQNEAISSSMNIISLISTLISISLISSFPILRSEDKNVTPLRHTWWFLCFLASPIVGVSSSILAAIWQHAVAATAVPLVQYLSSGAVVAQVGPAATALVWSILCLSMITAVLTLRAGYAIAYRDFWDDEDSSIMSEEGEESEESEPLTSNSAAGSGDAGGEGASQSGSGRSRIRRGSGSGSGSQHRTGSA